MCFCTNFITRDKTFPQIQNLYIKVQVMSVHKTFSHMHKIFLQRKNFCTCTENISTILHIHKLGYMHIMFLHVHIKGCEIISDQNFTTVNGIKVFQSEVVHHFVFSSFCLLDRIRHHHLKSRFITSEIHFDRSNVQHFLLNRLLKFKALHSTVIGQIVRASI